MEICKLRLFLKLVAQLETYDEIEPLPDIDFNIRAGNTLVGYYVSSMPCEQGLTLTKAGHGQHKCLLTSDEESRRARIEHPSNRQRSSIPQYHPSSAEQQTGARRPSNEQRTNKARLRELANWTWRIRTRSASRLAAYGIDPEQPLRSTQHCANNTINPFHWFAEFSRHHVGRWLRR